MEQARIKVIEKLYSSVCDEAHWAPALQELSNFVGAKAVFHLASNSARNMITAAEAVGVTPELVLDFQAHFADKEIRIAPAIPYSVGVPLIDWQLLPLERIRESILYNEFLIPNDIPYLLAVWLRKGATESASLSFQGTLKRGPFTADDAERFATVVPHLLRAYEARELLIQARATCFAYRHLLDGLPFGVILLDATARVLDATTPAESVLREKSALTYFDGRLRAVNPSEHKQLSGAIDAVCRTNSTTVGATIHLRRSVRDRITVMVLPVPRESVVVICGAARCMLLLLDSRSKLPANISVLQTYFELTHAEAVLALELFRSPTLRDAAQAVGRTYNTCKTQLKSIYEKVQVSSRAELAKKIMLVALMFNR